MSLQFLNFDEFDCFFFQEFISFYSKTVEELSNFKEIDANFSLKLPFRDVNIQDDSIVSLDFNVFTRF